MSPSEPAKPAGSTLFVMMSISLLLTGAIFGFFYAYSVSVMRGLDQADPRAAIVAMQGINATVRNAWFAPAFFGTPLALLASAALAFQSARRSAASWPMLAAVVYLLGAFVPTFAVNVPMNEALASVDPATSTDLPEIWASYSGEWTWWNHLRTIMSALALIFTGIALTLSRARA